MKAMILAAGMGTRLRPLTDTQPKALVPLNGVPLLEIALHRLQQAGVQSCIVNVHYLGEQIIDYLRKRKPSRLRVEISDERELLLDTGGALRKARWFFDDEQPFFVVNADVVSTIDLPALYQQHLQSGAMATLAVRKRKTSRYLLFDEQLRLRAWEHQGTGQVRGQIPDPVQRLAFSGIQVINPSLLHTLPETEVFSLIDWYLERCAHNHIAAYLDNSTHWTDAGTPQALLKAESWLRTLDWFKNMS